MRGTQTVMKENGYLRKGKLGRKSQPLPPAGNAHVILAQENYSTHTRKGEGRSMAVERPRTEFFSIKVGENLEHN